MRQFFFYKNSRRFSVSFWYRAIVILVLVSGLEKIHAVDEYYRFPGASLLGSVSFEKERKLCLFPLVGQNADATSSYLSNGIPSVLLGELQKIEKIFDANLLPMQKTYSFGDPKPPSEKGEDANLFNRIYTDDLLQKIYKGTKKVLPEKDPRYLNLKVELLKTEKPPFLEDILSYSRDQNCFYNLVGTFQKDGLDSLSVSLVFYNRMDGSKKEFLHSSSFKRAFQEMSPLVEKIRKDLYATANSFASISTNEPNAFVYVDGIFIGKSPVVKAPIYSGLHELMIFQEGYEVFKKTFELEPGKTFEESIQLKKNQKKAYLSVTSEPAGANVYLGAKLLGTTPLEKVEVPAGANRLRVSLEEKIDSFKGVDLAENMHETHSFTLREGETELYYKNKRFVFLDYTYNDFSTYSLYTGLMFYASHIYWNVEANKVRDSLRSQITITNASAFTTLSNSNPDLAIGVFLYESQKIAANEKKFNTYMMYGGNLGLTRNDRFQMGYSIGGMILSLASSAMFFYLGFDEESVDIGFQSTRTPNPDGLAVYQKSRGHGLGSGDSFLRGWNPWRDPTFLDHRGGGFETNLMFHKRF